MVTMLSIWHTGVCRMRHSLRPIRLRPPKCPHDRTRDLSRPTALGPTPRVKCPKFNVITVPHPNRNQQFTLAPTHGDAMSRWPKNHRSHHHDRPSSRRLNHPRDSSSPRLIRVDQLVWDKPWPSLSPSLNHPGTPPNHPSTQRRLTPRRDNRSSTRPQWVPPWASSRPIKGRGNRPSRPDRNSHRGVTP